MKNTISVEKADSKWELLCKTFLPISDKDSIWMYNRHSRLQEPSQGWKLHISATVLEACILFERVAPFLAAKNVQFKAPKSLEELAKLNSGLHYGYRQVGKFITVYPKTESQAVRLAKKIHELTIDFTPINIPFDEQYLPKSSVFYRYGGFTHIEITEENGEKFLAIENPSGKFVPDNRLQAIPDWLENPFPKFDKSKVKSFENTPLGKTYKIFQAITQRGKGGTYLAIDFSRENPHLCIVKEGRRYGEIGWNGQDGYFLVKNEFEVLSRLGGIYDAVPKVAGSFEVHGNFYFSMEYVDGKSLQDILMPRRRRLSIKQTVKFALQIIQLLKKIHQAGWVWNDCKPANLILTNNKNLRPIDFENAYQIGQTDPFDWKTKGFAKLSNESGISADFYAFGAVVYFLLTGKFYESEKPVPINNLRRNIPLKLTEIIKKLLSDEANEISLIEAEFDEILRQISV